MAVKYFIAGISISVSLIFPLSAFADTDRGYEAYRKNDFALAFKEYSDGVNKGDLGSYVPLGSLYVAGKGVAKDLEKGFRIFLKGAELGDANSQMITGLAYLSGSGVPEDAKKGVLWLQKAVA